MKHTTTLTYDEWFSFVAKGTAWLNKLQEDGKTKVGNENTKLGYAVSRMLARVQKALEKAQRKHQNAVERARIGCCDVDEKGKVLTNPTTQGYEFNRDKLMEFRKKVDEMSEALLDSPIEIETYFATDIPEYLFSYQLAFKAEMQMLTGAEVEAFLGVVLENEDSVVLSETQNEATAAVS